jgi:putative transposase
MRDGGGAMISFKAAQFPRDVMLFAVFFYVRYTVSYRDADEIMAGRGVQVDHSTLNRWVAKCSPPIANTARRRKAPVDRRPRKLATPLEINCHTGKAGFWSSRRGQPGVSQLLGVG